MTATQDMEHLIASVEQWADDRNLIEGTTILHQYAKLIEEAGELGLAILRDDQAEMVDGIGDMLVVLINICTKVGVSMPMCLAAAYREIRDRKGRMVNGTFVKDEGHRS